MRSLQYQIFGGLENRTFDLRLNGLKNGRHYLEVLVSLPQHSGRCGSSELFQPPPSA
jgi:hypothetical protein